MADGGMDRKVAAAVIQAIEDEFPKSKHGAVVLRGGGLYWVECLCGWSGEKLDRGAGAAAIRWAEHMRRAARQEATS